MKRKIFIVGGDGFCGWPTSSKNSRDGLVKNEFRASSAGLVSLGLNLLLLSENVVDEVTG